MPDAAVIERLIKVFSLLKFKLVDANALKEKSEQKMNGVNELKPTPNRNIFATRPLFFLTREGSQQPTAVA